MAGAKIRSRPFKSPWEPVSVEVIYCLMSLCQISIKFEKVGKNGSGLNLDAARIVEARAVC